MPARFRPYDAARLRRRRIALALLAVLGVIAWGTLGLMWIEGWSFARALYFTLITITTVGYGDEGIDAYGRTFTVLFLLVGIGVSSYSFALLVQSMVIDNLSWKRRMQKHIDRLERHVIVCGFGRMGRVVCRELSAARRPFVVIEPAEDDFREAINAGWLALHGSASDDDTLRAAGVGRAADLVSLAPTLADNLAIALTARGLGPKLRIQSRAEDESEERKLRRAGADRIVSPFRTGGVDIATAILKPKVAEFLSRAAQSGGGLTFGDVRVEAGSALEGRRLSDYGQNEAVKLAFVSLEREGEPPRIPPRGAEVLRVGDHLVVAGDPDAVLRMCEHANEGRKSNLAA